MRPYESHSTQGAEAWLSGKNEADNPYPEGSLARDLWLEGHLDAMVQSGDLNRTAEDCAKVYLEDTILEARRAESRLRLDLPSAMEVAESIEFPLSKWPGNCYAVAVAMLESGILEPFQEQHGRLFPAYGMYDGPLAHGHRRMNRHGWLESAEGFAVDPTRWVFTGEYPHIWAGRLDDYDLAGMRLRSVYRSLQAPKPEGETLWLGLNDPADLAAFDRMLKDRSVSVTGRITPNRLHWIVTSPIEAMGSDAPLFLATADRLGLGGFVPTDTRLWLEFALDGYTPDRLRAGHTRVEPLGCLSRDDPARLLGHDSFSTCI